MSFMNNRTPTFWTALICCLFAFVIAAAALVTDELRESQFKSRIEHIHLQKLRALEKTQAELEQKALITAQLLKENQLISELLVRASKSHRHEVNQQELTLLREELQRIINPYWIYLQQYGVKQLHFHLAPGSFTLYRAHKPEFHSDVLEKIRPLVMATLNTGQTTSGLEMGINGLGLRAVVPVIIDNQVMAAIEVGYGLSSALSLQQSYDTELMSDSGSAYLINNAILEGISGDEYSKFSTDKTLFWNTKNSFLHQSGILGQIPSVISKPTYLSVLTGGKTLLLTLVPWFTFQQSGSDSSIVLMSWQDVTSMHRQKSNNDLYINSMWFLAFLFGFLSVFFISRKMQISASSVMALKQRDLAWSEQKLRALYDLSPYAISLNKLSDGTYLDTNHAMEKLTGYTFEEIKKLNYFDLTPECFAEQEKEQLRLLEETGAYGPYRKQYRHKSGELIDIELRGVKFISPNGDEMIWSIITDLRESIKLERLKQEFISTVSHELRTPLTSVNGSLDLLLSGAAGELPAKAEKLLGIAVKNNKRLITLVNDLLDMEKLSQGKLIFKQVTLKSTQLLQNAIEHNLPFALKHKVGLQLGHVDDVYLYVDPDRIDQVLTNLISNAAKFSPKDSTVFISTELRPQTLRIAVSDQGRGLTADEISKLFQRFSQLDNGSNREQSGSGLGLAISREIISQSGGQIGVDSEYGSGSTFWFELPLLEKTFQSEDKKQILIVEDDADTAFILRELLITNNYSADIAYTVADAWLLLQQNDYDLITLDLHLQGESGSEFFSKLRDTPEFLKLPVLVISAFIVEGKLALNAVANTLDWLEKPVKADQLCKKIEYLLSQCDAADLSLRILHVEDDEDIVSILKMQFKPKYRYHHSGSLEDARSKLRSNQYDLVLLDIGLPDGEGWSLLPELELLYENIPVIIFSAQDITTNQRDQVTAVFGKTKVQTSALVQHIAQLLDVEQI